ncbi:TetR/AcrR family transcriptional regulator [Terriglobus roseus]|uniref:Transcriptional regulator, TetR family n=1 Tax=Terriglobus roseus TaxID=392734 RepID=A0A1G7F2L0_9BACT|nr:TetR/AcrR family transcriptional regulator [Terriglobus roseus]SDE69966.1 transcriptional regulator, TetR family [Terriglobus roseus]
MSVTAAPTTQRKSEETRRRILDAALEVFSERGFEAATMREVAAKAGMAVGAAYYYFPSKDAIVLAFYEEAQQEMRTALEAALARSRSLDASLRTIIQTKFDYFGKNRPLVGALASHVDPKHPLSPFSANTAHIREQDQQFFERAVEQAKLKLPKNVAPYLPRLLWMYQMGLFLFWIYDESPEQSRTGVLLEKTLKMLVMTLKLAALPIFRPFQKLAGELLEAVYGG